MPHPTDHIDAWWRWIDQLGDSDGSLPRIIVEPEAGEAGWEIQLPALALSDTDLLNVTISPYGIYVENTNGDWDVIPYSELSELLQSAGCRNLDEPIDCVEPRLAIIAKLGDTVTRSSGQPGYVATGAQLIQAAKAITDWSL